MMLYKQINVLWGDQNHKTVCLVRSDVTDMLATEHSAKEELERALVLSREASQAKSDFLSAMSHDIRTPMNAIIGMTTLARVNIKNSERVLDCLQKISTSSNHLLSLINDILDMNKIERAQLSLNHEQIYLPDLIKQISSIISTQADQAGLRYDIQMCELKNNYFYGDSLRISQILINILGNAIKFTPRGGRVHLLVEEIFLKQNTQLARYRFTIHDTGIGIAKELQEHLFEPFVRSHLTKHIEGSGLGLSIVKGLVSLMNGKIDVESEVNQGTTFRIELMGELIPNDKRESHIKTQSITEINPNLFKGYSFLIAEDNEINAEIITEILQICGAKVDVKENGALVVETYRTTPPGTYDAILMDIQMPVMDGYEATQIIRSENRYDAKIIPIIAMTANAFEEDIKEALKAGMNAHISKPIETRRLFTTLKNSLL